MAQLSCGTPCIDNALRVACWLGARCARWVPHSAGRGWQGLLDCHEPQAHILAAAGGHRPEVRGAVLAGMGGLAAIDHQGRAGQVGVVVRRQHQCEGGDLFGGCHASKPWHVGLCTLTGCDLPRSFGHILHARGASHQRRVHRAGHQRIDADISCRIVVRSGLNEPHEAALSTDRYGRGNFSRYHNGVLAGSTVIKAALAGPWRVARNGDGACRAKCAQARSAATGSARPSVNLRATGNRRAKCQPC
jgi:hypothetical protein